MSYNIAAIDNLVDQFAKLKGIGRKTAARLAYNVLSMSREDAGQFAEAIENAHKTVKRCEICKNFTDTPICRICSSEQRDKSVICVVETPKDVMAFERTREYNGLYHVLHGLISPMDGVGPEHLTIKELIGRLADGTVKEIIVATNPTIEGDTTAMYVSRLVKPLGIKATRLAYGMPVGGNLEYTDEVTLYRALEGRKEI